MRSEGWENRETFRGPSAHMTQLCITTPLSFENIPGLARPPMEACALAGSSSLGCVSGHIAAFHLPQRRGDGAWPSPVLEARVVAVASVHGPGAHEKDIDTRRTSSRGVIPKAKVKTVKMTLIIALAFVFCWSPYFIYDLLQVYGVTPKTQAAIAVATFIQSLAPLNSVANPLICCFFSSNMCRHIQHEALLTLSPHEPPSL
ncbi:hypothetical protein HPB51_028663 [Rhipicephalus microplus]|uniref:G-protein coupled receptors family 1 profile domain-containing protein n=1 Tax=Rhipicephalus microplus TaxID=6941 RepID=A0A9J6CX70_RHIMP|nr:hypothetical protein HPB51_028663 [Rhipicephalus microplus]